ncbi:response regulator transcription factor [Paenibacillus tuaregi]|uniref:response regulator transcription factor n=1 Tax=Paenibacillus tuaregi TaxID=1816681 RepID=UPI000839136F|nr:response regulator transcription factor [Paenibacillus tuaregi]
MGNEKILIVDDDPDIVNLISEYLGREGYSIATSSIGQEALEMISQGGINLVILDIMLPHMDGFEICRRIREYSDIPILLISAKSTDIDKVVGLRTGADDYIVKPFSAIELAARVEAQLRRYIYMAERNLQEEKDFIHINELKIDIGARSIFLFGQPVKLTKTEYDILLLLARNANRVFTLEEIFEKVWKERSIEGSSRSVMVHIARLRSKIEEDPRNPRIIKNVWGVGYRIEK